MFDLENQEDKTPRRARPRLFSLLCLLGGMLIGVVLVLTWQAAVHPSEPTSTTASSAHITPPATPSGDTSSPNNGPTSKDNDRPQYFWDILKTQVAQGLHLSVDQVKTELQSGQKIQDVAGAQGISQDQLHTIEINAIQEADNEMVRRGFTTQPNIDADMQRWRQEEPLQLNGDVTNAFLLR